MANKRKSGTNHGKERTAAALEGRSIVRSALTATLATIDAETGYPNASLVLVATAIDGSPLLLISALARHTRNLTRNPRASLLFDGTAGLENPLEGGRISLFGNIEKQEDACDLGRFVRRHPSAGDYADFSDFSLYSLRVEGGYFVGGFGRIMEFGTSELTVDLSGAEALAAAEPDVVEHMNADHADTVELYATQLLDGPPGAWRLAGCDPEGCDLVLGRKTLRLNFATRVATPQEARNALVTLARQAGK